MQIHCASDEKVNVQSTLDLAMELARDVRRCLNKRAERHEQERMESLRVALANPIPATYPPRPRDVPAALTDLGRASPLHAVRRGTDPHHLRKVPAEAISTAKMQKRQEVALMGIITLAD